MHIFGQVQKSHKAGLEINIIFLGSQLHLYKFLKGVVYIKQSLGSLQKFEGVAGEFKDALSYQLQLIPCKGIIIIINTPRF